MKLIWNSTTPFSNCGYGIITRELVSRLIADGHKVTIATKHQSYGNYNWGEVDIFEGLNFRYLNNMIEREGYNYLISLWDIWILYNKLHPPKDKWVGYIPIDTEWIAKSYAEVITGNEKFIEENEGPGITIAMSKHGVRELESIGLKPLYAPIGVDTDVMKPSAKGRKKFRGECGFTDDNFVVGSVGLNYRDDRKGFVKLMQAFKKFIANHPEARLYLHTHAEGVKANTVPYAQISEDIELYDYVMFANQEMYDMDRIDRQWLSETYNSFDVFCLPTKGEGFGMPILEAQACGVPVITTATTTGPELAGETGWLIDVDDDDMQWMPTRTWRYEPKPSKILECLEIAYSAWKYDSLKPMKRKARQLARTYDWNVVWDKYWKPILKHLEERLDG